MKKFSRFIRFTLMTTMLSSLLILIPEPTMIQTVHGVPADPSIHEFTQPDGTKIEYFGVGDEFFNFIRTPDGYIIDFDEETGYFCYAIQVDFMIVPTNLKVGIDSPPKNALTHENLIRSDMLQGKPVKISVNGKKLLKADKFAETDDNAVYLPLRMIFEKLDFKVKWDKKTKTVKLSDSTDDNHIISIQIGEDYIIINGEKVNVVNRAKIEKSNALLPLSIFKQILGDENISVTVNENDIAVNISSSVGVTG